MVQFLLYTEYPSAFTAFSSSINLPLNRIKKIIYNQSDVVLLRITTSEVVVVPRKSLKPKECLHQFNKLMGAFEEELMVTKKQPGTKSAWLGISSYFKRQPLHAFPKPDAEQLLPAGF